MTKNNLKIRVSLLARIKNWLDWHAPRITTGKAIFEKLARYSAIRAKQEQAYTWAAIRPVVYDLERLRANTWDQDKITWMQTYLRQNFEVKDDSERFD